METSALAAALPGTDINPHQKGQVVRHLGVRYARLTNGQRFDPPILVPLAEALPLVARFTSTHDVPVFPQLPSRLEMFMGTPGGTQQHDEDAFFLNVFAPEDAKELPVLVFIHGGAWVSGAGTADWYDGSSLAQEGVCVVSVNYRIHATGHLSDASEHRPLQDLEVALNWVQENIERFGGDPQRVTLAGQSAGGWYVHALSRLERLRGKFAKVALLSMGTRAPWSRTTLTAVRQRISQQHQGQALSDLPIDALLQASISSSRAVQQLEQASVPLGFTPAPLLPAESTDLPADFLDPYDSATHLIVTEVFVRYTLDETGIFLAASQTALNATAGQVEKSYQAFVTDPSAVPEHLHQRMIDPESSPYERLRAISSWAQFQELPIRLAEEYSKAGKSVQLHEFSMTSQDPLLGSCHCLDLPYQFGNFHAWQDAPMLFGVTPEEFAKASEVLVKQLTDFVCR